MNALDTAILVILGIFLLKGLLRGLLKEVCSLAGLLSGTLLAFAYHAPLAQMMADQLGLPPKVCVVVTFLLLFLSCLFFFAVLGYILTRFVKLVFLGGFNRLLGGLFGALQGVVLLAVVLYALSLGTLPEAVRPSFRTSQLGPPFIQLGDAIFHLSTSKGAKRV